MKSEYFLGVDIGGTEMKMGVVNPYTGELLSEVHTSPSQGVDSVEAIHSYIQRKASKHPSWGENTSPHRWGIGIAVAGPVDSENLTVKTCPNLQHLPKDIGSKLQQAGYTVRMINDVNAAALAVATYEGAGNATVSNHGTGYNIGVVRGGKVALHPEFGHSVYNLPVKPYWWEDILCGCGTNAVNHVEAFTSGSGTRSMAQAFFAHELLTDEHAIAQEARKTEGDISLQEIVQRMSPVWIYDAFEKNPQEAPQSRIVHIQQEACATVWGMIATTFSPTTITLVGGMGTRRWKSIMEPAVQLYNTGAYQHESIPLAKIKPTSIQYPGIKGAALLLI